MTLKDLDHVVYSGTNFAIFIEIGLYLIDKEQKDKLT